MKFMGRVKRYFRDTDSNGTFANLEKVGAMGERHKRYRFYIVGKVKPEGKKCLDVGCGLGRFIKDYNKHNASFCVGVDINQKNLTKCKSIKGTNLVRADIENLPFRNDVFDVVSCIATMEHLPNPSKAMRELATVARRGGLVCTTFPQFNWLTALWNPHVRRRLLGALLNMIEETLNCFIGKGLYRNKGFTPKEVMSLNRNLQLDSLVCFKLVEGNCLVSIARK